MFGCLIKKGAKILVLDDDFSNTPKIIEIEMPKEKMYFEEEVIIDPIGNFPYAIGPHHTGVVGSVFAQQGFYGFKHKYNGREVTILARPNDRDIVVC